MTQRFTSGTRLFKAARIVQWLQQRVQDHALRMELEQLTPELLDDIGLCRREIPAFALWASCTERCSCQRRAGEGRSPQPSSDKLDVPLAVLAALYREG